MTEEKSASTTPAVASSTAPLPPVLASHLPHHPVLRWLVNNGRPLTVETYCNLNWYKGMPEKFEPEEQELLEALREYEFAQRRP